ncbi:hypothetical protein WJX79_003866 [Trebouxia sp. C0005]
MRLTAIIAAAVLVSSDPALSLALNLSAEQVLQSHHECPANFRTQTSSAPVLAYVTPWNNKGYEIAERLSAKFTHIAPVWLQLHWEAAAATFTVAGQHDIDAGWMEKVMRPQSLGSTAVRMVPRILFELDQAGLLQLLSRPLDVADLLVNFCNKYGFDGLVVETWSQWAASGLLQHASFRQQAVQVLRLLAQALHRPTDRSRMELILAVPPFEAAHQGPVLAMPDFEELRAFVDFFSLMTYDASSPSKPGPNAPWKWVKSNAHAVASTAINRQSPRPEQVLLGLNFYGNDYTQPHGGGPIIGHEYLSLLKTHDPVIRWDQKTKEHVFNYVAGDEAHEVYYPTKASVQKRLELAHKYGLGISIWEIGQGLDHFYDLF